MTGAVDHEDRWLSSVLSRIMLEWRARTRGELRSSAVVDLETWRRVAGNRFGTSGIYSKPGVAGIDPGERGLYIGLREREEGSHGGE